MRSTAAKVREHIMRAAMSLIERCRLLRATAISRPSFFSWSTVIAGKARYERLAFGICLLYPYEG
jgi:hypothetical protein